MDSKQLEELVGLVNNFRSTHEPSTTAINTVMSYIDLHASELAAAPGDYRGLVELTLRAVEEILYARRDGLTPSLGLTNGRRLYGDQFDRIKRIRGVMNLPFAETSYVSL